MLVMVLLSSIPKKDRAGQNLSELFLNRLPRERADDVAIIESSDDGYAVGVNILQGNPDIAASNLQRIVDSMFPINAGGVTLQRAIYHCVKTLMTTTSTPYPMTIAEIEPLCVPRADEVGFADQVTRGIKHDPGLARFWQDVDMAGVEQRGNTFGPLLRRLWQINGRPQLLHMFGQSSSTINIREILEQQKILIINVGGEDDETLKILGAFLLNTIWGEIISGACSPERPVYMFADEFQKIMHLPVSIEEWLSEARSQGLGITMAHQNIEQTAGRRDLLPSVMVNARTKMAFQMEAANAAVFARTFGRTVTPDDLTSLGRFEVMLQIMTDSGVSRPVTGRTHKLRPETGLGDYIRQLSRMKYARPVSEVEADIKARRQAPEDYQPEAPPKKGQRWGLEDDGRKL